MILNYWLTCTSNVSLWNSKSIGPTSRPAAKLLAPTIFHTLKHWYQYTYLGLYLFFDGAAIFGKKIAFLPQNKKNFVVSCFSRSLNCSSSISRYVLGYIWGLDKAKQNFWLGYYFRKYSIFGTKWVFKTKPFFVMDQTFTIKHFP